MRLILLMAAMWLAVLLVACGSDDPADTPTPMPTVAATPTPVPTATSMFVPTATPPPRKNRSPRRA